ncbi:MAG TPA: DUF3795 domain-containing protein [Thermoanaerobaculia bacterium]|nr:DUF3795 domain-containing protein [Thermoanaerobaculia bacterium]
MEQVNPSALIAFCGLNCAECGRYKSGHCVGCHSSAKATWCGVRTCCIEHDYSSCAQCGEFSDPMECDRFNNFFSKLFGVVFNSDRGACIDEIRKRGLDGYAKAMADQKLRTIPRRGQRPDLG